MSAAAAIVFLVALVWMLAGLIHSEDRTLNGAPAALCGLGVLVGGAYLSISTLA